MMPDKTYHPREVLRNQEKNRKQKYSAQTTESHDLILHNILPNAQMENLYQVH